MLLNFIKLAGWQLSGVVVGWMKIFSFGNFQVGVFLGGSCPGENLLAGSFPGWDLPGWELSYLRIFFGGSFPGGNCLLGFIRIAIFRVRVFMLLKSRFNQKSNNTMPVMLCTEALFVKKNSCLVVGIVPFDTTSLHLLTFRILEPYLSKDI